jgi:hypothetical protein
VLFVVLYRSRLECDVCNKKSIFSIHAQPSFIENLDDVREGSMVILLAKYRDIRRGWDLQERKKKGLVHERFDI